MITVSDAVEKIVIKSDFLEEALAQGIINLSALSRKMKKEVKKNTQKKVSESAILMALKRLSKRKLLKINQQKIFSHDPEIIVRSSLIEYTFFNSPTIIESCQNLINSFGKEKNYFLTITQGVFETGLIANQEKKAIIEKVFKKEKIKKIIDQIAAITIRLPEENIETPGVYYLILKTLAWEGINVVEVVSTFCEFTLVVKINDVDKAFSILKNYFMNS